ncbi:MAG: hypothetical protein U5L04_12220 [Trueperaceae bacterium]|nr:hypothetical protein [Trueperaceae bacterium]
MKLVRFISLILIAGLIGIACAQDTEQEVVTIGLDNVGASAWVITGVEGAEDVAETGVNNATITLTPGVRYSFDVTEVNSSVHPLDFRDADGNFLLAQGSAEGSFEADEAVAFEASEDAVSFTFTAELADAVATYHCTVHRSMVGDVAVAGAEDAESEDAESEEDATTPSSTYSTRRTTDIQKRRAAAGLFF